MLITCTQLARARLASIVYRSEAAVLVLGDRTSAVACLNALLNRYGSLFHYRVPARLEGRIQSRPLEPGTYPNAEEPLS